MVEQVVVGGLEDQAGTVEMGVVALMMPMPVAAVAKAEMGVMVALPGVAAEDTPCVCL